MPINTVLTVNQGNTAILFVSGKLPDKLIITKNDSQEARRVRMPRAVSEKSLVGRYFLNGEFHYALSSSTPVEVTSIPAVPELTATVKESVGGGLGTSLKDVLTADLSQSGVSVSNVTLSGLTIHEPKDFYSLDFVPATFPRRLVTGLLVAEKFNISFSEEVTGQARVEVEQAIGRILPIEGELTFSESQAVVQTGNNLVVAIRLV